MEKRKYYVAALIQPSGGLPYYDYVVVEAPEPTSAEDIGASYLYGAPANVAVLAITQLPLPAGHIWASFVTSSSSPKDLHHNQLGVFHTHKTGHIMVKHPVQTIAEIEAIREELQALSMDRHTVILQLISY